MKPAHHWCTRLLGARHKRPSHRTAYQCDEFASFHCTASYRVKISLEMGMMSAMGHEQTYAVQNVMSALPPIATAKADICPGACLLYPRKRTCAVQLLMSALEHKRTSHRE